mgnify:CR=1 FL=1
MEGELLHRELTFKIRGLLYKVHNELGHYRNEQQYGDALERHLKENNIPFQREYVLPVGFAGERSGRCKVDLLIESKIILELKCVRLLSPDHYYQCQRYLQSACLDLALLINFRSNLITIRRVLNVQGYQKNKPQN